MHKPFTSVIIAAAGRSSRMTLTRDKLFADLCGKYVIERTLEAFEGADSVDEIVIVTSAGNLERMTALFGDGNHPKVAAVVEGGATRADSVSRGIAALSDRCEFISVQDGARPFLPSSEIDRLHTLAYRKGCLCCGAPVTDTVKATNEGLIEKTLDRAALFAAQTPQIFKRGIYLDALKRAGDGIGAYTDDSALVEAAGYPVYAEITSLCNIKITTESDLILGRAIIDSRSEKI